MKNEKYALPPDDVKLKSINQVLKENSDYKDLIISVLENLGDITENDIYYDIQNIKENGAGGGYGNYIYYADIIKWLKDRSLQNEIGEYFKNWAEEIYVVDKDFSYLVIEHDLMAEDVIYDEIYWDNLTQSGLFNLTYTVCKNSPYFKSYNEKELTTSVYNIFQYMDYDKDIDLDGQDATFISWFVLEGVCYMFERED